MYCKVNSKFMKEKSSNLFCMLPTIWAYCGEISFVLIFSPSRYEYSTIVEQSKHNLGTDFNVTWNRVVSLNYERIDKSKESFSLKMAAKEDKTFFEFNYEYTDFAKVCLVRLNLIGLFLSWDEGLRLLLSEMICCNTMSL